MSDPVDRQAHVTGEWMLWRKRLGYTPSVVHQIAFCHLVGLEYDLKQEATRMARRRQK